MGKFKLGQEKPQGSGRKSGSRNKRTQHLVDILESVNFSIPQKLIELLPKLSDEKQADVMLEMMSFVYPKRKSSDVTTSHFDELSDRSIEVTFVSAKNGFPA
jgi:hypothetical protein